MRLPNPLPSASSSVSVALFALLPKCPACFAVLLAPLGISLPSSRISLAAVAFLLLLTPALWLLNPGCRRCGTWPLLLALTGYGAMMSGRFLFSSQPLVIAGSLATAAAFCWMIFGRNERAAARTKQGMAKDDLSGATCRCTR